MKTFRELVKVDNSIETINEVKRSIDDVLDDIYDNEKLYIKTQKAKTVQDLKRILNSGNINTKNIDIKQVYAILNDE